MRYSTIHKVREDMNPRRKVAVVGAMHDGPVGVPFVLRHGIEPVELLGECPAAYQATSIMEAGVPQEDIILFRVNGVSQAIDLFDMNSGNDVLRIRPIGLATRDKEIQVHVQPGGLLIQEDEEFRTYVFEDYANVRELATRMNRDADSGLSSVEVVVLKEGLIEEMNFGRGVYSFYLLEEEERLLFDESQERDDFLMRYMEAFNRHTGEDSEHGRLLDVPAEAFVFSDLRAEEAYLLNDFMEMRSKEYASVAFYHVEPLPGKTVYENLGMDEDGNFLGDDGNILDQDPWAERELALSRLVNAQKPSHACFAVYGHAEHLGERITLEGATAARYVLSEADEDMTNKEIGGFDQLIYDLRKEELAQLYGSGYICIVPSVRRRAVPYRSQFFRTYESMNIHRSPRLWRLGNTIGRWMAEMLADQIGEPTSLDVGAKQVLLEDGMKRLQDEGIINEYVVEVSRPTFEEIRCRADIRLPGTVEFITVERSIEYSQQEVFRWME